MTARDRAREALRAIGARGRIEAIPSVDGLADAISTAQLWEVGQDEKIARALIAYLSWEERSKRA